MAREAVRLLIEQVRAKRSGGGAGGGTQASQLHLGHARVYGIRVAGKT